MPFNESVLHTMTVEELLREPPSELLCKILIERMDADLDAPEEEEKEGLEGLLDENQKLLENISEPLKRRAKPYRELIGALERLHKLYS